MPVPRCDWTVDPQCGNFVSAPVTFYVAKIRLFFPPEIVLNPDVCHPWNLLPGYFLSPIV